MHCKLQSKVFPIYHTGLMEKELNKFLTSIDMDDFVEMSTSAFGIVVLYRVW